MWNCNLSKCKAKFRLCKDTLPSGRFPALPLSLILREDPLPNTVYTSSERYPEFYALLAPLSSNNRFSSGSYVAGFSIKLIFPFKFQNWTRFKSTVPAKVHKCHFFSATKLFWERLSLELHHTAVGSVQSMKYIDSNHKQTTKREKVLSPRFFLSTNQKGFKTYLHYSYDRKGYMFRVVGFFCLRGNAIT